MGRIFGLAIKSVVPAATFVLAASLAGVARAGDNQPKLSGRWEFNKDQSDDAQKKISDARQNSQRGSNNSGGGYPGGGGGYPGGGGGGGGYPGGGGGYPGGGGGWPGGGMGLPGQRGGMGRSGGQGNRGGSTVSSEDWDRLAENPRFLRVDQGSDQVLVTDDSDRAQTFHPDGKKHDEKDANGKKVSTKTEWQGAALVAETKLSHSSKLTQTFRLSDDGKQLYVTSRLENPSLQGAVSIQRVYDLLGSSAREGSSPK
jgi:hypothetical protein